MLAAFLLTAWCHTFSKLLLSCSIYLINLPRRALAYWVQNPVMRTKVSLAIHLGTTTQLKKTRSHGCGHSDRSS